MSTATITVAAKHATGGLDAVMLISHQTNYASRDSSVRAASQ